MGCLLTSGNAGKRPRLIVKSPMNHLSLTYACQFVSKRKPNEDRIIVPLVGTAQEKVCRLLCIFGMYIHWENQNTLHMSDFICTFVRCFGKLVCVSKHTYLSDWSFC